MPGAFKWYGSDWLNPCMLIYVPLSAALIVGWCRLMFARKDVLLYTLPAYMAVYLVWPFEQGSRFLTPMVPVLWVCLWAFIDKTRWRGQTRRLFLTLFFLGTLTSAVYWANDFAKARRWNSQWETIENLATSLTDLKGDIAYSSLPSPIRSMLSVALDKPVSDSPLEQARKSGAHYIVTTGQYDKMGQYHILERHGPFIIFEASPTKQL
jgi:hypothetical protein